MKNSDNVKINSVNPFYIIINRVDGSISEKNGNKYLTFAILLEKYTKLWDHIQAINADKSCEYEKDYRKIKFH